MKVGLFVSTHNYEPSIALNDCRITERKKIDYLSYITDDVQEKGKRKLFEKKFR